HSIVSRIFALTTSRPRRNFTTARSRAVVERVAVVACLVAVVVSAFPSPARGAWVTSGASPQFQVGGQLFQVALTNAGSPVCTSTKGGTSLALVQGFRAGLDPVLFPVVLVVSCLDSNATNAAKLNFVNPLNGTVIKQISTSAVPSTGWAHLVLRPDKGDLLGCGANG